MPFRPEVEGERPTLGHLVVEWIEEHLASPDGADSLVTLTREQVEFCLRWYELDAGSGLRKYRRGVLSRAKGWGRSPFLAMIAAAESFAPVVPDGWDAEGRPVGKPWASVRRVWVQFAATSEPQTRNAWAALQEMLGEGPLADVAGVLVQETRIDLPHRGRIEYATSSATSKEGARPIFCLLDQTESWTRRNGGAALAAVLRRNLGKVGGTSLEAPNAFRPGAESVAEDSWAYWLAIKEGRAIDDGLMYDHREAPAGLRLEAGVTDEELVEALRIVYGDSSADARGCAIHPRPCVAGWVDLRRIVREIRDPDTTVADASQFYLNRPSSPADAFVSHEQLARITKPTRPLAHLVREASD